MRKGGVQKAVKGKVAEADMHICRPEYHHYLTEIADNFQMEFRAVFEDFSVTEVGGWLPSLSLEIEKVIFNDPATIVFWRDGCKTVVKAQDGEPYDKMVGLAMACCKYAFGNKGNYYNVFKKWIGADEK